MLYYNNANTLFINKVFIVNIINLYNQRPINKETQYSIWFSHSGTHDHNFCQF